jgi:hypothetical protein
MTKHHSQLYYDAIRKRRARRAREGAALYIVALLLSVFPYLVMLLFLWTR